MISVFLVDDHAVVRRGLASYLEGEGDMSVVGQAANGRQALDELAVLERAGSLPDVVLADLLMPELDGVGLIAELGRRWPSVRAIAVTSFLEEARIRAALEAGAAGYLLKDAEADDVADAVRRVTAGEVHLQPSVAGELARSIRRPARPVVELTPRERQVVHLVAEGRTNQQIATALGVTERTARAHVSNILTKLGLTSRTQAAVWARDHGIGPDA